MQPPTVPALRGCDAAADAARHFCGLHRRPDIFGDRIGLLDGKETQHILATRAMAEQLREPWAQMSSDIHTAIKALDLIYTRLLRQADALRRGADNIRTMERLLDQTRPVTEEDRNLAFFICLMASFKRGDLVAFLFKIRRACLLLLIDGQAAATALRLADTHVIWIDAHGRHHINPISNLSDAPPAGGIAAPNVVSASADGSVRHSTSERSRNRRGPRAATAGKVRNPNRPVMDCQDLIAKIDAPDSAGPPSNPEAPPSGVQAPPLPETAAPAATAAGKEPSYLAALIRGGAAAAPAAAAPAAPAAAAPAAPRMRPATPAPMPRPAAALPPFDVVPTNIRWGDFDDIDRLDDIDDMHLVDLGPLEMF